MNGGSSAPCLACTPCVPLFSTLFNRGGNRRAFRLPGRAGDHFHCTVEPSPGHIRCRWEGLVVKRPGSLVKSIGWKPGSCLGGGGLFQNLGTGSGFLI